MTKNNKSKRISNIDLQIKELEERKKKMIQDLQISVGSYIIKKWDSNDEKKLKETIDALKDEAKIIITKD